MEVPKFRAYNPATSDWYGPKEVFVEGGAFVTKGTRKKHYQSIDQEKIERVECLLSKIGDGYEVIGDIYRNPELVDELKGVK